MQPQQNSSDDNWQQPKEQPAQSPYAASAPVEATDPQPVVTLTPDPVSPAMEPAPMAVSEEETQESNATIPASQEPVHWQAHEYIHHEKNAGWFVAFALVVIVLITVAIFLMQSWTFAILIPVMAAALIVYTRRPPRLLDYTLSPKGLYINDQLYPFGDFKGFGVIHDGLEYSVMLIPIKRFRPGVSVYFPEEQGEAIVDMLGVRLPMQELHLDSIDKLIRKLRI